MDGEREGTTKGRRRVGAFDGESHLFVAGREQGLLDGVREAGVDIPSPYDGGQRDRRGQTRDPGLAVGDEHEGEGGEAGGESSQFVEVLLE